ncbi:hypothetical protein AgCh_022213 [Apium graveolens]
MATATSSAVLVTTISTSSVLEEEEERGVAHIVEHLAFSATNKYTNHDIIKFLESYDAEFGACQNAATSSDETVYELFVPVDKPEVLPQTIYILAEFSSEMIWRKKDEQFWKSIEYAKRLPIGLEKVIRTVSPGTVKQFYRKWYHLKNMVVVAIGDFADT